MSRIIIHGDSRNTEKYIESYITSNNFKPHEIKRFESKIKIEDARSIRHALSMKIPGQFLFVLAGELTTECQNALLKSIEESLEHIHFIFAVTGTDSLLETIRSRCRLITVGGTDEVSEPLYQMIKSIPGNSGWEILDQLSEQVKKEGFQPIIPALRRLLIEQVDQGKDVSAYYLYCKRILPLSSLSANNNVNEKIILEMVFQ